MERISLILCILIFSCSHLPQYYWVEPNGKKHSFNRVLKNLTDTILMQIDKNISYSDTFYLNKLNFQLEYKGLEHWEQATMSYMSKQNYNGIDYYIYKIDETNTTDDETLIYFNYNIGVFLVKGLHTSNYYYLNKK